MVNVICMKWGVKYGPEYVNTLRSMLTRHLQRPHRFICYTDDGKGIGPGVEIKALPTMDLPPDKERGWRKSDGKRRFITLGRFPELGLDDARTALVVNLLLLWLANIWVKHFDIAPVEWAWRSIIEGRALPWRKRRAAPAVVGASPLPA